jgi:exoribonuclease II
MIPRTLSDELCSLKEGEERNTLCARLLIAEDGLLLEETEFFAARITPMPVSAMTTSPTGPSTAKRWISTPASWPSCP